jgi:hypothetical protein
MPDVEEQLRRYGAVLLSDLDRVDVDAIRARRRRGAWRDRRVLVGVGVALVAALLVSLAVAFDGSRGQHIETVGQPDTASIAPSGLPRMLLGEEEGWEVTRADEGSEQGEMTFAEDDREVDLRWTAANEHDSTVEDRRASSDVEAPIVVGGRAGIVFHYSQTSDYTAVWFDGDHTFELVGGPFGSLDEFRATASTLETVDEQTWLAAMPDSVVAPGSRAAIVADMVADIPLPPSLDLSDLATGSDVSDRYQLGAQVTSAVACGWVDEWVAARRVGDVEAEVAAEVAMSTSRDWAVLREMETEGAWAQHVWQFADAMEIDGIVHDNIDLPVEEAARGGLGCHGNI